MLASGIMLLWFVVSLVLNDRRLGRLVTKIVTGQVSGKFILTSVHYDYWSSLASLVLNTPARVVGQGFELRDPNGDLVAKADRAELKVYIGELVRGLVRSAVSAPFGGGVFVELHASEGTIDGAWADIHPIQLAAAFDRPGRPRGEIYTDINIVATMSGRKYKPDDEPPSPGHVRILIDRPGVEIREGVYAMGFPGWHGEVRGLHGLAALRFSSDSSETRPGLPGFVHEEAQLSAREGLLVLGTKEGAGEFHFPLKDIRLRRFGARPSHRQDLAFRGEAQVRGAKVELDGALLDTFCDPGVRLEMSFEQGAALTQLIPGGLLKELGEPRGRVRFFGPFSTTLPRTLTKKLAPCLNEPWHRTEFSSIPEQRNLTIEGQVAGVHAEIATIAIADAQSNFELVGTDLTLPNIQAQALGGTVRAEPLKLSLSGKMPWSGRIAVAGADPSQVSLVPPFLRPFVAGKLRGSFRVAGHLAKNEHPERVTIERVDTVLDRLAHHDPLPKELKIAGAFLYNPDLLALRGLAIGGEAMSLSIDKGTVGMKTGRLDIPQVDLHGKGAALSKVTTYLGQSLGMPATVEEGTMRLRIGGSLDRPDLSNGTLAVSGLDVSGQRLSEVSTAFALHDGMLDVKDLSAKGTLGNIKGGGGLRVFQGNISQRPADPAIWVKGDVADLNLSLWNRLLPITGLLRGSVALSGTLGRPLGTLHAEVNQLGVYNAQLRAVALSASLQEGVIDVSSLGAKLGAGAITTKGILHRDGDRYTDFVLSPRALPLADLPFVNSLPFALAGTLSGDVRVRGSSVPLRPRLSGELQLHGVTVSGWPESPLGPPPIVPALPTQTEPASLFSLLNMVVRTLGLSNGTLTFVDRADGATLVTGRLFGAFQLSGEVFLDLPNPRGELFVQFGCPSKPGSTGNAAGMRAPEEATCHALVEKLVPELAQLGDLSLATSGLLRLRFGGDPRELYVSQDQGSATCPKLAVRPLYTGLGLPLAASLRLGRASLDVRALDDDGDEHRYRVRNRGDLLICSDGQAVELGQVQLDTERVRVSTAVTTGVLAARASEGESRGELRLAGLWSPEDTQIKLIGQIELRLLENLLRATFRHVHGTALVDVMLQGRRNELALAGRAQIVEAELLPHGIDVPVIVKKGELLLSGNAAKLQGLTVVVDGATTTAEGKVAVPSWLPLRIGEVDFLLSGEVSARLLQWQFARNLAEARGSLGLSGFHVTGTFAAPIIDGTIVAKDLFLNLRRFHELAFQRGTVVFQRGKNGAGKIFVGCPQGMEIAGCTPLSGTVDGDGKVIMNGRIDHNGIGNFIQPMWYRALDDVKAAIVLENVRHTSSGVYSMEVSSPSPGLSLVGSRDGMRVAGKVELVSGRYMQDFDLSERFLTARRIVEDEAPFWEGDPFLSSLHLSLNVYTRGTMRVLNNIADLRLTTTDFVLRGPLERVSMGGVIRAESGYFSIPGMRTEFQVRGDSKIEFSPNAYWPETPYVDVRGSARELDSNDQQRNVELALRGKVNELRIDCLSSDNMSSADCASFLLVGSSLSDAGGSAAASAGASRPLSLGDPAARLFSSQLLTNQVADPLREKLRLDTVRIQFGVSSFDVQLCKRFGLYLRMCGLAEWGLFGNSGTRYRGFGELQLSDFTVGQVSLERIERGFSFLEDTVNRFKVQAGVKLPLRY